jgi:hypothetical protein
MRFACARNVLSRVLSSHERVGSLRRGSLPGWRSPRDADVLGARAGVRSIRSGSDCNPELDPFGADDFSREFERPAAAEKKLPDTFVAPSRRPT